MWPIKGTQCELDYSHPEFSKQTINKNLINCFFKDKSHKYFCMFLMQAKDSDFQITQMESQIWSKEVYLWICPIYFLAQMEPHTL